MFSVRNAVTPAGVLTNSASKNRQRNSRRCQVKAPSRSNLHQQQSTFAAGTLFTQQKAQTKSHRSQLKVQAVAAPTEGPASEVPADYEDKWVVHKYGGTCVGSAERIKAGAELIINTTGKEDKKFLIVSAMGGKPKVTDMMLDVVAKAAGRDNTFLEDLGAIHVKHVQTAKELLPKGPILEGFLEILANDINNLNSMLRAISIAGTSTDTFSDFVVGHGEIWCAQLMSALINSMGVKSSWMDARDVITVDLPDRDNVVVDYELSSTRLDEWRAARPDAGIVVMTGFIAETRDKMPTTLKRNGSDYSATIMGYLLKSRTITIWTDVDGVYSADPRKVEQAVCLDTLSYHEAWELSYFGANVLHPQCTLPAMNANIPVIIRNFFNIPAQGTAITSYEEEMDALVQRDQRTSQLVKGFATIDDVTLINVEGTGMVGVPGTASKVFESVRLAGVNVVMISQASSEHSICFAVKVAEADSAVKALSDTFAREIQAGQIEQIRTIEDQCILAAVGQGMSSTPGVSAILFSALAKANINVSAIAQGCSEYNLTVVVSKADSVKALKAAHARFYLSETPIAVALVGPGLIGSTLLDQMREQINSLDKEYNIDIKVVAIANSKKMLLNTNGLDLNTWEGDFENSAADLDMEVLEGELESSSLPNVAMIDCSASGVVSDQYLRWMKKGFHVVTCNKKANSGDIEYFNKLRDIGRKTYTHFFYEATVGAGLPIVNTMRNLVESGDKVRKIEGIFSGTLSYIFNTYDGSQKFSEVVRTAKDLGYTEPDPRDDLSGLDVARKVVILAREAGLQLSLDDIALKSLVPAELENVSTEEYLERLPEFDQEIADMAAEADAEGKVLRFVGTVDMTSGTGSVQLGKYDKTHPFATLTGSDNIINFITKRYLDQPLIVRGPGAGAQVTAGGVFSDLLLLSAYLGAPS
mmetsp:Transcript_35708/g.43078  ORF Transcript_35708/g.43078 Transcript_35708/m.43078 type:complete len:928 (+) Transcript_35708:53-2836(+)